MGIFKEFRDFAMKGNVIDLAVGVVIGTAFGKIVTSLVENIIMPLFGMLIGGVDFTSLKYVAEPIGGGEAATIAYGTFLQNIFDFLIIAFSIFLFVKLLNKAKDKLSKKECEIDPKTEECKKPDDVLLLEEIRDLLKTQAKVKTK